jgi:peptidoglycan/LPS O-acetylase OafA/YrhL
MFRVADKGGLIYPIAAFLVIYGTIGSRAAEVALSTQAARFFGAISFPIYLLHVPVICTIFASLCVGLYPDPVAVLALIAGSLVALVTAAFAAEMLIERPLLRALGRLRRVLQKFKLPGAAEQAVDAGKAPTI